MSEPMRITPAEASARLSEGYAYVDVRSEPEFAAGHPAGASNVPLMHLEGGVMTPNPRFVEEMRARFGENARLVVGCKTGGRSLRAARQLLAEGFTGVVDQRAGWEGERDAFGQVIEPGWSAAGLPGETGADAARGEWSAK